MDFGHVVLGALGASMISMDILDHDPQTKEEFEMLQFKSEQPITWEMYCEKYEVLSKESAKKALRMYRNRILPNTDWIMAHDNVQTLANLDEWIRYRQLLRDLPNNITTIVWKNGHLDFSNIDLPVEPPILRKPIQ